MDVLRPRCGGLDVHESSISACVLLLEAGLDAETPASLWRDDPRTARAWRMATTVRSDSGINGIQAAFNGNQFGAFWRASSA